MEEEPGHRFWVKPTISRQCAQENELLLTVSEFQSSDVFSETALFVTARVSRNSLLRPWPSARSAYLKDSY